MQVKRLTRNRIADMLKITPREQTFRPSEEICVSLADMRYSWIAYAHEAPVAAFGAIPMGDPEFFRCWAFVDKNATTRTLALLRRWIERFLNLANYRRLEITVKENFDAGLVWASRLGFEHEGTMRRYDAEGNNHHLLARVKNVG